MTIQDALPRLKEEIHCRDRQLEQLAIFLNPFSPNVSSLVLYGPEATGKTLAVTLGVKSLDATAAIVDSRECITGRHLLERTIALVTQSLEAADYGPFEGDGRCENLSVLAVELQKRLGRCPRFYLIFDGVDRQREAPPTLLPALARLGDMIPSLTCVFIVAHPAPLFLHKAGVPHVEFPPYSRGESLTIVERRPLPIFDNDQPQDADDAHWLWPRFCALVWDSLARGAARDVAAFRELCEKLWPPFVAPIRAGSVKARELSQLVNRTRGLFQNEDALRASIVPAPALGGMAVEEKKRAFRNSQELSYYSKYLLIAAYLASHNPPRTDDLFFMKMHEKKKRKTKKSVAAVSAASASAGVASQRPMKHRKVQRRLLGAQPFVLERLLAIFHAILPHAAPAGRVEVLVQVATLAGLKLLTKTVGSADVLDPGTKWRVNVGWEYTMGLAKGLRFEVDEYLVD